MNYIAEVEIEILKEIEKTRGIKAIKIIEQTPLEYKRIVMLIALGSKNNLELKKMLRELKEKEPEEIIIGQIEKIIERFRKYIPVGKVEKKSFGEVFTPFTLVNEMLDTLPIEVWSNPNLKWADLCNGMGNFMIIIIKRLMIGLREWEPNEARRYRHIVENMIYVAELQVKNMFLWMLSIDPKSKLNINIYRGDSLHGDFDKHMREVWKIEKFDIIVGNPPYQDPNNKRLPLWEKFINKSLELLNNDGFLVFVNPSSWRKPKHFIFPLFKERNLRFLEIHNQKDGIKTFGAGTRYDFYLLENNKYKKSTILIDEKGIKQIIDITLYPYIPNFDLDIFDRILAKESDKKLNILHSRTAYGNDKSWMSSEKTDIFKYPCVHATSGSGNKFLYSSLNTNGYFGVPKIILGKASPENAFYDEGSYGITNNCFAIPVSKEDSDKLLIFIKSKSFKKIIESTKFSGFSTDIGTFLEFKENFWKEFIN